MNMKVATIRRRLRSCGVHDRQRASTPESTRTSTFDG
jgi:hypothetical protein